MLTPPSHHSTQIQSVMNSGGGPVGHFVHSGANTNARFSDQPEVATDLPLAQRQSTRISKQTQHFVKEHSRNYEEGIIGRRQMSQGSTTKRDRDNDSNQDNGDDEDSSGYESELGEIPREPENIFPPGQSQMFCNPQAFTLVFIPRVLAGALLPTNLPCSLPPLDAIREHARRGYNAGFTEARRAECKRHKFLMCVTAMCVDDSYVPR